VAVVGVFAQAHIGDEHQVELGCLEGPQGLGHDALGVVSATANRVLVGGYAKEDDGRNAQARHLPALLHQLIDGELAIARHGGDFAAHPRARTDEERQDQILAPQVGLADHLAQKRVGTQAAGPERPHCQGGLFHGIHLLDFGLKRPGG